ncbi:MAG TPA: ParB/RepB/Spo0J family partition protein [Rhodocyclaceae bacterium]|jgi:ParB family chromosome partitioning protein
MAFKQNPSQFQMIDVTLIEPDARHPRRSVDEASLKGLVNSIQKKGLIHPLVVQPANGAGKHTLIVGQRRLRAAILAGETVVPALIRACDATEALEVQVFENLGLGVRAALEPREMANAIQAIAEQFDTQDAAAEHFGRSATWLTQATAAANLSAKVNALLDSGKISSTSTAIQLEKLAQKNEAKAESLIDRIEQLPEGEKVSKQVVDSVLSTESSRRKKKEELPAEETTVAALPVTNVEVVAPVAMGATEIAASLPSWEAAPAAPTPSSRRVNSSKVKLVADILGLSFDDEDEVLDRLLDEFLALKGAGNVAA